MALWRDIWRIINRSRTSTYYANTAVRVRSLDGFKALPLSKQEEINLFIENEQRIAAGRYCKALDTLNDVKKRSAALIPLIINNYRTSRPLTASVRDAISNMPTMLNVQGQDPSTMNAVTPNLYLSPQEAVAIYSQQGLPATIINKKGKSPLLNGVRIKNPYLTPKQRDIVRDDMVKNGLANKIVEALMQSLVYGGALLFPMFKHDNPLTMSLPIEALLRYGIVGKGCIDWMVALDRWNCVHIPNWNPASKDFLYPKHYYVPFLGSHVSGERCARIVTAPQYGYWAVMMTLGWGVSDIPGWIEAVYNYHNVMAAIPTMIAQMSILVRTLNVDQILATNGWDILENIDLETTRKIREASPNNPINMDLIGDIKSVERDFKEVPALVRLIRQDLGGRSDIPEELLFSSERGAFSSGDTTEGALEKQWEPQKYIHRDVAHQLKNVAMLEVVNALGKDREVLSALPYTTIEFDNPLVANAEVRSKILANTGKAMLDISATGLPLDAAVRSISENSDDEFKVPADIMEELRVRQAETDRREAEKHEKEMALLDAQIDLAKEQAKHAGDALSGGGFSGGKGKILASSSGGHGYSRLDQKKHEKTRGTAATREGLQRREGKKLG
jgi:hypothetical protein